MTIRTGWRHLRCALPLLFVFVSRVAFGSPASEADNKALIRSAFEAWRAGTGGPFSLLAPDATWTIAGHSIAAGRYLSRDEFMTKVIAPFNARLARPLVPTVPTLVAEGDSVIALFDAWATALDGKPYHNSYAWFMTIRDRQIVCVIAFFDSIEFNEFWRRVVPGP